MQPQHERTSAFRLAEHLECMLAACAELVHPPAILEQGVDPAGHARRAELAAITHLLQAREHARQTFVADPSLTKEAALFLAGTDALERPHEFNSPQPLLGRRITVSAAVALASLVLEAFANAYLQSTPVAEPGLAAEPDGAEAPARHFERRAA